MKKNSRFLETRDRKGIFIYETGVSSIVDHKRKDKRYQIYGSDLFKIYATPESSWIIVKTSGRDVVGHATSLGDQQRLGYMIPFIITPYHVIVEGMDLDVDYADWIRTNLEDFWFHERYASNEYVYTFQDIDEATMFAFYSGGDFIEAFEQE